MPEPRSLILSIGALVLLASISLPSHAGAPPDEGLGENLSFQSEVTIDTTAHYPAEPVTEPMKTELTEDLHDFGITGAPVFDVAPKSDEVPEAPFVSITATALENPPERIVWNKTPIRIMLAVGTERLVDFPADFRIGLPSLSRRDCAPRASTAPCTGWPASPFPLHGCRCRNWRRAKCICSIFKPMKADH